MKKRFEEILEECLTAQLEGRRSVEDSLSLYPALASDLEPLLRTASDVAYAFEALTPPGYLQERGRLRFLAAASERRRAREIANGVWGFSRSRAPWNVRHWGVLGAGVAAAVALVIAGGILVTAGGGEPPDRSSVGNRGTPTVPAASPADFVSSFDAFRNTLDRVKEKAARGEVSPADLAELREATSQLARAGEPPAEKKSEVSKALSEQLVLATELSERPPEGAEEELQELASVTEKTAIDLGVELPVGSTTPVPEPSETPVPTPPAATPEPTPTAPPEPTAPPAETSAPTPTPPLQFLD